MSLTPPLPMSPPICPPSHPSPSPPPIPSDLLRANNPFPSPFGYLKEFAYELFGAEPRCRLERRMQRWSAALRAQEGWRERRNDEAVVAEWKKTAPAGLTPSAIDYVVDELQYYATLGEGDSGGGCAVEMSAVEGVWQSRVSPFTPDHLQSLTSFVHRTPPLPALAHREGEGQRGEEVEVLDPFLHSLVADRTCVLPSRLPLPSVLHSLGLGSPLTRAQYRGLLSTLRTAVVPNLHLSQSRLALLTDPVLPPTSPLPDSSPLSSTDVVVLTVAEDEATINARERSRGKIRLTVVFSDGEGREYRELRVYVHPTAVVADVKAELLSRPLVDWTTHTLQVQHPYTDNQMLVDCDLHERSTAYQQLAFVALKKKDTTPPLSSAQRRRFLFQIQNERGILFTTFPVDLDGSVGDVLQALHDGKGTNEWRSMAMRVPLDEMRLELGLKRMHPHRRLREYLEVNSSMVDANMTDYTWMLQWRRKTGGGAGRGTSPGEEEEKVEVEVEVEAEIIDPFSFFDPVATSMQVDSQGDVVVTVTGAGFSCFPLLLDVHLGQKAKVLKDRIAQAIAQRRCEPPPTGKDKSRGLRLYLRSRERGEVRLDGERTLAENGVEAFSRFIVRQVARDVKVEEEKMNTAPASTDTTAVAEALPTTAEAIDPLQFPPSELSTSGPFTLPPIPSPPQPKPSQVTLLQSLR